MYIYMIGIVMLVLIDQLTKFLVDNSMFLGDTLEIIPNFFHITYVQNRGIAFGVFQGKINIISVITVLAIILLLIYFIRTFKENKKIENVSYLLIVSGAIGNMIDRVFRGYVVDMIDFRGIWSFVFNMSDVYINIGVALIILDMFLKKDHKSEK
ncbi:signal peptidase II [Fusobacterium sp. IOR10]|uniref:signal peptidase II n=1 Tax=Fusobacterium sp. IOR10 TaxID=2665157 RepID=UPI0013D55F96|nr:signal peptidase II [Fusobacterium sp. IOR10]